LAPRDESDIGVPEAVEKLSNAAVNIFAGSFLIGPTPRERIQRGQFFEVTPLLVGMRQGFDTARVQVRRDQDRGVKEWAQKARDVYTRLARAREHEATAPGSVAEAKRAEEQFWQEGAQTFASLVNRAVADAGLAESTYLLALCKHEQAEQLQARAELLAADPKKKAAAEKTKAQAADAWREALGWWQKYEPFAPTQDRAYPGRAAHAKRLTDRAAAAAKSG
jgi:hypothetical protein